jgi:biopolymer transport protein ExbD
LTLKSDLTLALGESAIARGNLASALDGETQGDKEQRVFVRADRGVPYGEVMELMNLLRGAGYLKIGLVGMEAAAGNSAAPGEPARGATETNSPKPKPADTQP